MRSFIVLCSPPCPVVAVGRGRGRAARIGGRRARSRLAGRGQPASGRASADVAAPWCEAVRRVAAAAGGRWRSRRRGAGGALAAAARWRRRRGLLAIPAPDGPVVRATILLALEVEARDAAEDIEPGGGVASNLDLRLDGPERVECLVEQVAHDAGLRLVAGGADVANRQVVVDAHVALDETGHLPVMRGAIEALEDEDVTAAGGAAIALAAALVIGMRQRRSRSRRGARSASLASAVRTRYARRPSSTRLPARDSVVGLRRRGQARGDDGQALRE